MASELEVTSLSNLRLSTNVQLSRQAQSGRYTKYPSCNFQPTPTILMFSGGGTALRQQDQSSPKPLNMSYGQQAFTKLGSYDILSIGSLVSDISCTYLRRSDDDDNARPREGSSNPARITQCVGGVAHNIALAAQYLKASVLLVSVIANDSAGAFLLGELEKEGLRTEGLFQLDSSKEHGEVRTGQYVGNYNHDKEFLFGMADVKLMKHPETEVETTWRTLLTKTRPKIIILDTTFSHKTTDIITKLAWEQHARVIVEPVSQPLARDFALTESFQESPLSGSPTRVDIITPNAEELDALFDGAMDSGALKGAEVEKASSQENQWLSLIPNATAPMREALKSRLPKIVLLLQFVPGIIVTFGADGCLLAQRRDTKATDTSIPSTCGVVTFERSVGSIKGILEYFPPPVKLGSSDIVSVNGAGDSLVGAVAAEWLKVLNRSGGEDRSQRRLSTAWSDWQHILNRGQWAAIATVQHEAAVSPTMQHLDAYKEELLRKKLPGNAGE